MVDYLGADAPPVEPKHHILLPRHYDHLHWHMVGRQPLQFVLGVKTDLSMIPKVGKKAVSVAVVGTLLPYLSVYLVASARLEEQAAF
ncbi:hypothetical protein Cni_G06231 [Canna indica]|uniref:Uncharacterized protein n=1 Tax=Canna indica TaxID=4628 RepID=A0AAQ3Q4K1_9LILI|nr:hypothetical protein Cni_G06231 [Canna indica]